ncbi:MAG TPA: TonB C-terminal domain-containing protein [Xanthobacteraceae bacterium]|nr:TonB C-terminal domain-containing protein [Xanthobacteraceae bacterium]
MLPRFAPFLIALLAAGIWALPGSSCAVAETSAPNAATSPQKGAPKRYPAQGELEALRTRLMQNWKPPAGVKNPEELIVRVRIRLKPDGTLASSPKVMTAGTSDHFKAARDSAVRAVYRTQPFALSPANYNSWKEIEITFDPRIIGKR